MVRVSISLTKQNDEWLKNLISQGKFKSISEAINHFIKEARVQEALPNN